MKKKLVIMLLTALTSLMLSGCGKSTKAAMVTPVTGVSPFNVTDIDENTVSGNDASDSGFSVAIFDGFGDFDLDAFEEDESSEHKLGDVSYVASLQDKRSETGFYSESTSAVWEYLNEDGTINTEYDLDNWAIGIDAYTGRFAFPTVSECDFTKDLYLYTQSDMNVYYIADEGTGNLNAILICTGYNNFNDGIDEDNKIVHEVDEDGNETIRANGIFYEDFTTDLNGEEITVYKKEKVTANDYMYDTYMYKLGGFTVFIEYCIIFDDEPVDYQPSCEDTIKYISLTD